MKDITPKKDKASIRLRFTVSGRHFSFAPLPGGEWENKRDRQIVAAIGVKIQNDILAGNFDPTLEKYRHRPTAVGVNIAQTPPKVQAAPRWLEIWEGYVESLNLKRETKADHYERVKQQILKAKNPTFTEIGWLESSTLAAITFNRRLSSLKGAINWAISQELISQNPLGKVSSRQASLEEQEKSQAKKAPFNAEEIAAIISYFQEKHPSYAPFVEFMLFSGVRTGEAVGLRWKDIDLDKKVIQIQQSITREPGKYTKVRKRPKTMQSVRPLKMSDRLYKLFVRIKPEKITPDSLIFTSPKGLIIDHCNFRKRYWVPALNYLEISYRKPYATRHTLLSHALESGMTIPQVAAIAGHKDGKMILAHYGHQINQPQLPE